MTSVSFFQYRNIDAFILDFFTRNTLKSFGLNLNDQTELNAYMYVCARPNKGHCLCRHTHIQSYVNSQNMTIIYSLCYIINVLRRIR